jgi:hypothetical protein
MEFVEKLHEHLKHLSVVQVETTKSLLQNVNNSKSEEGLNTITANREYLLRQA